MTISTSTGLVSGINTADIIDQLMAIEAQTTDRIEEKITAQETVQAAWMSLSASILSVQSSINGFESEDSFSLTTAATSNESVLMATAASGATLGTFQFTVKQMAQNHQLVSSGYAEKSALVGAGEISFDMGRGKLNRDTDLALLNGQNGVASGKIRITDRAGTTETIDLTKAITLNDVIDTINASDDLDVTASISGDSIVLTDSSGGTSNLIVENVGNSSTATDLGLAGSYASSTVTGGDLVYLSEDTAIGSLNDGNGIDRVEGSHDMKITLRDGTELTINLLGAANNPEDTAWTVGDILDSINNATGNEDGDLQASISADGNSITLVDSSGGSGDLIVSDLNGSLAASQLGLAGTYSAAAGDEIQLDGDAIIAGLNTVLLSSLQGGNGVDAGQLQLIDRDNNGVVVDLSNAHTLAEVIEEINGSGVGISASLNEYGTGLVLTDTTGSEDNHMVVSDVTGNLAATLGIEVDDDVSEVSGTNANLKYVSQSTLLDDFCGDEAWDGGKIKLTSTNGATTTVNLGSSNVTTIGDVLTNINSMGSGIGISARINDSGTGIVIEDSNGGAVAMKVEEVDGGKTASQLNIAKTADIGDASIDGSLRTTITLDSDDTLEDLVSKINEADIDVSASIFSDQSSVNPYRLMLVSETSGRDGELVVDTGSLGMSLTTTAKAQDAVVFLGAGDSESPVVITSSTNEIKDVIDGVTLDITGTDDSPVTITIDRDMEGITASIETFVSTFNSVITAIDSFTTYDSETEEKGVLFADSNVSLIRSKLLNMAIGSLDISSGAYNRLNQVGITLTSGNKLEFDSAVFNEAFSNDPDSVITLFTDAAQTETKINADGDEEEVDVVGSGGIGVHFNEIIDTICDDYDGMITTITDRIDTQIGDMKDRVTYLDELLSAKRARLEQQFINMEMAISKWQSQSTALSSLSSLSGGGVSA